MDPNQNTPPVASGATENQRTWSQLTHGLGVMSALPGVGVLALIVSAAMWRLRHAESAFLDDHGREATNFQISIFLYSVAASLLAVAVPPLGGLAWLAVGALTVVGCIRAALAAGRSEYHRYPASIRLFTEPEARPFEHATPY